MAMSAYSQFGYSYPSASQLLIAGQPTTATSPPLGTGGSGGGGGVGAGGLSPGGGSGSSGPPTSCCENGRPIMTDPLSGQTVCSCQYDSARLALQASYPRLSTSGVSVYGTPYPSTEQNPYPSIGVDSSAFYSPLSNPYSLKDGSSADMSAWTSAGLQQASGYYPYDPTLAAYGYGAGYDLAARRKNATRESTATLKAWLNEHKKNPYPTKGEKIMLAIITKMTLTQVSTWFANARRRLKKENKMTWEPKNKTDDDDDAMMSDDEKDKDDLHMDAEKIKDLRRDDKDSLHHVKAEHHHLDKECLDDDLDDLDDDERKPGDLLMVGNHHHLHHHHHHGMHLGGGLKDEMHKGGNNDCGVPIPATKPKIWSLADTAACKTPPPPSLSQQQPWMMQNNGGCGTNMGMNMSMNSFALPSAAMSPSGAAAAPYSRYGGILSGPYGSGGGMGGGMGGHVGGNGACSASVGASGFPEVQTDTPPQTPPNMKLPSVAGNLLPGSCFGQGQGSQSSSSSGGGGGYGGPAPGHQNQNNFLTSFGRLQHSPHKERPDAAAYNHHQSHSGGGMMGGGGAAQASNEGTAFKPFYKSSQPMGSGFVSPV